MKILITGATGFIGKNLIKKLNELYPDCILYQCSSKTDNKTIEEYTKDCDFVFYLAATHRPKDVSEFHNINFLKFKELLDNLEKYENNCPVLYTSSIQANNGSEYGKSKTDAENALIEHSKKSNSRAIIYRLSNTFGPYGRPNGHSVAATFCYNIQRDIPIKINDKNHIMNFYYVGDVIDSFIDRLNENITDVNIYTINSELIYSVSLGDFADLLYYFKNTPKANIVIDNDFKEKLYFTFNSYKENNK